MPTNRLDLCLSLTIAWNTGVLAAQRADGTKNPYPKDSCEWNTWNLGYMRAFEDLAAEERRQAQQAWLGNKTEAEAAMDAKEPQPPSFLQNMWERYQNWGYG